MDNAQLLSLMQRYMHEDVFYLPSFGPVHAHSNDKEQLFKDVLGYWDDKTFLPYDKGKRWFDEKEEYICVPEVSIEGKDLYLPVLNTFGKTTLKVYVYSNKEIGEKHLDKVRYIARKIQEKEELVKVSLVTNKKPTLNTDYHASKLYFKEITDADQIDQRPEGIKLFDDLSKEVKKSFENLAKEEDLFGSQMLWHRFFSGGQKLSPVFVAVEKDQILGMIGPMDTLADPWGKLQLLAPYFEVSNKARRKGYGSKLWQSATDWAWQKKAEYLIIQAEEGEAANYFYPNEGLEQQTIMYSIGL